MTNQQPLETRMDKIESLFVQDQKEDNWNNQ